MHILSYILFFSFSSIHIYTTGYYDLAVGNVSGSNTFEILVCLGMVWFARSITQHNQPVYLETSGFRYVASVLLISYLVSLLLLGLYNWKIDRKTGIVSLIMYVVLLVAGAITQSFIKRRDMDCEPGPE